MEVNLASVVGIAQILFPFTQLSQSHTTFDFVPSQITSMSESPAQDSWTHFPQEEHPMAEVSSSLTTFLESLHLTADLGRTRVELRGGVIAIWNYLI